MLFIFLQNTRSVSSDPGVTPLVSKHQSGIVYIVIFSYQVQNFILLLTVYMCVGATKGTYRRDIKMIVNHDYIKQCIIFAKIFFGCLY